MRELDRRGVNWKRLARSHGLDLSRPAGGRVAAACEQAILRDAEILCGDPLFGWTLGEIELRDLGLYGYSVLNEQNVGNALHRLVDLSALVTEASHLTLSVERGEARLTQSLPTNTTTSQVCLRAFLCHLSELVGPEFQPLRVGICGQDARRIQGLAERAQCEVEATAAWDTYVAFPARLLDSPLAGADPMLARTLQPLWTEECARLRAQGEEMLKIRDAIAPLLPDGTPTLDRVADAIGIPARSLRARLAEIGPSLAQLIDCVRSHLVAEILARPGASLAEAAWAVGLPDPRDFDSAYRRWFGAPPPSPEAPSSLLH
ncbi:MAG: AraC family transcriptional regulator ligand-binding domain-containing protein [Geminicoccaceae bacterium]